MSYHRSRTPHGNKNSEWISRQVATFGRYQERRPAGLRVDASGAFQLSNLMQCWGQSQGLTEEDVRNALIENQSHGGHQRFTLEYADNDWSNVKIRVHKRNQGGWQQTSSNSASGGQSRHNDWSNKSVSGSHGQNKHTDWWSSNSHSSQHQSSESSSFIRPPEPPEPPPRKLPTPNRAFNIFNSGTTDSSESKGVWDDDNKKEEKDWFQHDNRSNDNEWWKKASKKEESRNTKQWDKASGEQIQKWLGWILKSGYREVGIFLRDREWGSLDVLAEILSSQKAHLNVSNAEDLKEVLRMTDEAGRFEIVDSEVRKVPRDSRVMRSGEDNGKQKWQNSSWGADNSKKTLEKNPWGSPAGSKNGASKSSSSQSGSKMESKPEHSKPQSRADYDPWSLIGAGSPPRKDEPATPEGSPRRDRNAVREDTDLQDAQDEDQTIDDQAKPPPPPGENWKKFIDEGFIWFFYDGPLGKWWCQEPAEGEEHLVLPYDEETEE